MLKQTKSPYLNTPNRLLHIIAAIQALGENKYYKLDNRKWADKISDDESKAAHWQKVFKEHPEFFRISGKEKNEVSLIWRRNRQRTYYFDKIKDLTREEVNKLSKEEQDEEISRRPLDKDEIATLINTAINMHSRAIEEVQDQRWWYTPLIGILGTLIGVVLGVLLN